MDIKINKIGEILADGLINIDENLLQLTATPSAETTDPLLRKIGRVKKISYGDLSRNMSYRMNVREMKDGIEELIKRGLITKTEEQGKIMYYRTQEPIVNMSRPGIIAKTLTNQEVEQQVNYPIKISGPNIWAYKNNLLQVSYRGYLKDEEMSLYIKQYVLRNKEKILQLKEEVGFLENIHNGTTKRRADIPDYVKMFVWQRDDGKCVKCGSNNNLEFDHIIPVSRGGSSTPRNLQILCGKCNREKTDNIA